MMRKAVFILAVALSSASADGLIPHDRVIKWKPGIPGGIQFYTNMFCDIRERIPGTNLLAMGDGLTDDSAAIQTALNLCPAGGVVSLPTGVYLISNTITLSKSGVVLRGAGAGRTILRGFCPKVISVNGSVRASRYHTNHLSISALKDSTNASLVYTNSLPAVGYTVLIDQKNDGSIVTSDGYGGHSTTSGREDSTRSQAQLVEVVAAKGAGFTFSPPLYLDYLTNYQAQVWWMSSRESGQNFVRGSGLEEMTIILEKTNQYSCIEMIYAANCWIKGVETQYGGRNHVLLLKALQCEVRDSIFHDVYTLVPGGNYGVETMQSTACLVENNVFSNIRSPIMIGGCTAGCVFGYNFITNVFDATKAIQMAGIIIHAPYSHMNLIEGNVSPRVGIDSYWGSNGRNLIFRNHLYGKQPWTRAQLSSVDIQITNLYNSVIGNLLGYPGIANDVPICRDEIISPEEISFYGTYAGLKLGYGAVGAVGLNGDNVAQSTVRHANYSFVTSALLQNERMRTLTIPDSFYLSERPSWWVGSVWPPIGPELAPSRQSIPAEDRFIRWIKRPSGLRLN